jgi:hypothetical protein
LALASGERRSSTELSHFPAANGAGTRQNDFAPRSAAFSRSGRPIRPQVCISRREN